MKSLSERKMLHGEDYVKNFSKFTSSRLERALKHIDLTPHCVVADFACGNGMLMELLANKVEKYVGVDFSSAFIDAANTRKSNLHIDNAEFVLGDINEYCRNNENMFDVGFAMDFSEHVYDEEWVVILQNIRKSLKKDGRLFIHTPNASFFIEIMKKHNFILQQFPEHIAVRNADQNSLLLRKAGFSVRRTLMLPHYNILRIFHSLSHLPFLGKYFVARIFIEATNA